MSKTNDTEESLLDILVRNDHICTPYPEEIEILEKWVEMGLVLRCDKIPHSDMMNEEYTYVTNDDRGKEWAKR